MAKTVETARTRRRLVEEAGWRTTSFISMLAGTLVAFGAVTLLAAAAGAGGNALGLDTDGISTDEWRQAGMVAGAVGAVMLFGSFFFGGYTAGRMSRRAGARHGLSVFLLSVVFVGLVSVIGWAFSDDVDVDDVRDDLRAEGVPTDDDTWRDIGLGVAIAAAVAMLAGSVMGGVKGERWHGRLATAVMEHRDAVREEEVQRTRDQHTAAAIGDTPVDRTTIDVRDDHDAHDVRDMNDEHELTVEEERERSQSG